MRTCMDESLKRLGALGKTKLESRKGYCMPDAAGSASCELSNWLRTHPDEH